MHICFTFVVMYLLSFVIYLMYSLSRDYQAIYVIVH